MVDPAVADFWVSWQDDAALADEVITGADQAIAWGRERADIVFIRLGHSVGTSFTAGDVTPPEEVDPDPEPQWPPPPWPPTKPTEGWWYPPSRPTVDEVAAKARELASGQIDQAAAREWAEVMICVHPPDDTELIRALWALRGTDEPMNR
jgi:hypothetical protein